MLVDSQAAIKALIKWSVTSITVFNCITNVKQLGKQNHDSIAWTPGHAGIHGNKVAHYVAKSGSKSKIHESRFADSLAPLTINNNNKKIFKRSPIAESKNGHCKFSARFLPFSNKISTVQKIVLSSSRGQGTKAKDLTFEVKAKDFKVCPGGRPRGQGRPQGLHL